MIHKYGLKMNNLRAASGNTINWMPRSGGYTQISYDRATGVVLTNDHVCLGYNSWTEYHDTAIIHVCNTSKHMTMQELADAIAERVAMHHATYGAEVLA